MSDDNKNDKACAQPTALHIKHVKDAMGRPGLALWQYCIIIFWKGGSKDPEAESCTLAGVSVGIKDTTERNTKVTCVGSGQQR